MALDRTLLDQMEDMALFALVVEQGSFSAAARRLGLTKSAVSKRVDRLESSLGARLLQRTTRSLSLTEPGRALHQRAVQSLALLEEGRNQVANLGKGPRGLLRVTASVAFGRLCLAPHLADFLKTYPDIRLQLTLLDRPVDLAEEGFDLAIRLTSSPPQLAVAKPLMAIDYVLCAAPDYLQGRDIQVPEDLAACNCLSYGYGSGDQEWELLGPGQRKLVKVAGNVVVNSSEVLRDLLVAGVGIGLVARYAVAGELARGSLEQVLPAWAPVGPFGQTAFAIWLAQPQLPPKIRVLVDFLQERLGGSGIPGAAPG